MINPKCSICRCYFEPLLKSSNLPYKTCGRCRSRAYIMGQIKKKNKEEGNNEEDFSPYNNNRI
jgi:hypothetical protein